MADAYIPWQWVRFPDTPPLPPPLPPTTAGMVGVYLYIKGDGRSAALHSDQVRTGFRLRNFVEFDLYGSNEYQWAADNQPSAREIRLFDRVLHHYEEQDHTWTHVTTAERTGARAVKVELTMSGSVPWMVAGPQPAIDYSYHVEVQQSPNGRLKWSVQAEHDGFPAHELFIEQAGKSVFKPKYLPSWFASLGTGTAHPTHLQAAQGAAALGGLYQQQRWSNRGEY